MKMRNWVIGIVWLLGTLVLPEIAHAHMRDYVLNQPYYTAKRNEVEVAFWNDYYMPEADNDGTWKSKHQVEVEYGITNHVQVAYYEVYTWDRTKDWERDAFKIELKGRLAEAGQWPVDIAFYTEYKNPDGSRHARSDVLENKVILSKNLGAWNLIGNFIFEKDLNKHSDWELEYTAGVSYALTPRTRLGLEVKQSLGDTKEFAFDGHHELYIAPGIYSNVLDNVRVLLTPVFGATRVSDDLQLRSLVEVEF